MRLPDQEQRERALEPAESFIVQAPAGSGKTGLLIQRYLRLLACVDQPEEILAATFTLKAAGEMRQRVIDALHLAATGAVPEDPHLRLTVELARRLLEDPARRRWQLASHPARLRIRTLDATNGWLAGLAPLTAGQGALRQVSDAPAELYREAAQATLALIGEDAEWSGPVAALLRHLDNQAGRFERLVMEMLPRRDQWLRRLPEGPDARALIEQALETCIAVRLDAAAEALPPGALGELAELLPFAASQLRPTEQDSPIRDWLDVSEWPQAVAQRAGLWKGVCEALLTKDGAWRKGVDVRAGFGQASKAEKARMLAVLDRCRNCDLLLEHLLEIRDLPPVRYTDGQWDALEAMARTLRLAAAQLEVIFAARGLTDFQGIAAAALATLGRADDPTDVGLALDYRISHILVDEFQDTSLAQFELLQRLTAAWLPRDGRTLFLVGDPMQSIYRFREAEVELFQRVREVGIGSLRPVFLALSANFRSRPAVVDWANTAFAKVFPGTADTALGGVPYSPCVAMPASVPDSGVETHWLHAAGPETEDARIVTLVKAARHSQPDESICILVRSRRHAASVIAALQAAGIEFVAPDIAQLGRVQVTQDLLALTRALQNPADRLAWIGLLRSPVVGLPLAVIETMLAAADDVTVPDQLAKLASAATDRDAAGRAVRLLSVMEAAQSARGRRSLRDIVEGAWLALGGAEVLALASERDAAAQYLDALEAREAGGDCADVLALADALDEGRASAGSGQPGVTLMTMHKAKGLEFDTVILPSLGRASSGDRSPLLVWQELPLPRGEPALVLAPCPAGDEDDDPHFHWLSRMIRRRGDYESQRLLYVAATRARRRLHLLATLKPGTKDVPDDSQLSRPRYGSLLSHLWPAVEAAAVSGFADLGWRQPADRSAPRWIEPVLRRLSPGWQPAALPLALAAPPAPPVAALERPDFEWAGDEARQVGTIVHQWLQRFAERRSLAATETDIGTDARWRLRAAGITGNAADRVIARVTANITAVQADPRASWLLTDAHAEAACELALTHWDGSRFRQLKIDRSFVTETGDHWIIDYKTASHEGGSLEAFLAAELERHRPQLEGYRDALRGLDERPIRLAIYFPMLSQLRELPLRS
ncbi:MAG: DNA helicase UvrD [Gammaproteobacteria bacterium]|nr:DNA helicase UvrD [Gammaproteobacteria bacterium]